VLAAVSLARLYERGREVAVFASHPLGDVKYREDLGLKKPHRKFFSDGYPTLLSIILRRALGENDVHLLPFRRAEYRSLYLMEMVRIDELAMIKLSNSG